MFETIVNSVKIRIELEKGIYVFTDKSATGKTRLFKLIELCRSMGMPVAEYTYNYYTAGLEIEKILKPGVNELVILDRYDMYNGIGAAAIIEYAKVGLLLIDCKSGLEVDVEYRMCSISMSEEEIIIR